jgi:hypothetical protein
MDALGNPLVLGFDEQGQSVRLTASARSQHVFAVGATGTGKSSWLQALVRQDLVAWPRSRCGMLLLDPDGKLFDDVMRFVAAHDLRHWPIVPLDLRRSDTVISYNPLRKRPGTEAAVAVAAVTEAILHAFGQSDLSETPRLTKWLNATLSLVYGGNFTLLQALRLISSPALRKELTATVEDDVAKAVWAAASHLSESEFQKEVESTVNRLRRFLATMAIRASLCQPDVSLDLRTAIDKGMIVLVSLATAGGQISDEDASTFGSLLLSDLWSAATARGKRDGLRPFYVFADEFQRFMTPAMAESLDRARGYAISFTLANQFPSQLSCRGESGERVYRSVLANARTKVTFQLSLEEDLQMMAQAICRQAIDPEEIKYQGTATRVVGHEVIYLPSYATAVTDGTTESQQATNGGSLGLTKTTNWLHTDSEAFQVGISSTDTEARNRVLTSGNSISDGEGTGESHQHACARGNSEVDTTSTTGTLSRSLGGTRGTSGGTTVSYDLGRPKQPLLEDLTHHEHNGFNGKRPDYHLLASGGESGPDDAKLQEATQRLSLSESREANAADNWNRSSTVANAASKARGSQITNTDTDGASKQWIRTQTKSQQQADGITAGHASGLTVTDSLGSADSFGGSDAVSEVQNWSLAKGLARSNSATHGEGLAPHLIPTLAKERLPPQYRSIDEQLFLWMQAIDALPQRHCFVRLVDRLQPIRLTSPTITQPATRRCWIEKWTVRAIAKLPFALPRSDAVTRLTVREQEFCRRMVGGGTDEPLTSRRRIR